jgi:hypothetical protein
MFGAAKPQDNDDSYGKQSDRTKRDDLEGRSQHIHQNDFLSHDPSPFYIEGGQP